MHTHHGFLIPICKLVEIDPFRLHPARGAWIEICFGLCGMMSNAVAPRTGCVD